MTATELQFCGGAVLHSIEFRNSEILLWNFQISKLYPKVGISFIFSRITSW